MGETISTRFGKRTTARRTTAKAILLGTAGAFALSGAVVGGFAVHGAAADTATVPAEHTITVTPNSFADVVEHVRNAVVSVKVKMTSDTAEGEDGDGGSSGGSGGDDQQQQMPQLKPGDPLEKFFKQFGEKHGHPMKPHVTQAQGSGFFITPSGYVVTNNHVVEHATEVTLVTDDGTTLPAKVIGTDKKTDLALLKVTKAGTYPFVHSRRSRRRRAGRSDRSA